jgi:hypothetical protein
MNQNILDIQHLKPLTFQNLGPRLWEHLIPKKLIHHNFKHKTHMPNNCQKLHLSTWWRNKIIDEHIQMYMPQL